MYYQYFTKLHSSVMRNIDCKILQNLHNLFGFKVNKNLEFYALSIINFFNVPLRLDTSMVFS